MAKKTDAEMWETKDRRIIAQNVLNRAVDMFIADKIGEEKILAQTDVFFDYIMGKGANSTGLAPGSVKDELPKATKVQQAIIETVSAEIKKPIEVTKQLIMDNYGSYPNNEASIEIIVKGLK